MKNMLLLIAAVAMVSCATIPVDHARPTAAIASAAYLVEAKTEAERDARQAELLAAASEIRLVADSANPTGAAVELAVAKLSNRPEWSGVVRAIVATYAADLPDTPDDARTLIRRIADGIEDVARPSK